MGTVALQAVGLPWQVERGDERERIASLRCFRVGIEAALGKHEVAGDGDHHGAGVGNDHVGARRGRLDAAVLLGGGAGLLVAARRSSVQVAKLVQCFVDDGCAFAARPQRSADRVGERRLAGALRAQQHDDEGCPAHAPASAGGRSRRHAAQPTYDIATNTA